MEVNPDTHIPVNYKYSDSSNFNFDWHNSNYDPYMQMAICSAFKGVVRKQGGPFGSSIVKDDQAIAVANNTVYKDYDPSCHAETNCIRIACKYLQSTDLSDCTMYATGHPCPMCYGASQLTKIKIIYVGVDLNTSAKYTFSDLDFYGQLSLPENERDIKITSGVMSDNIFRMIKDQKFPETEELQQIFDSETNQNTHTHFMQYALSNASWTYAHHKHTHKAPFGAAVVKDGKILATGKNRVIENNDITASAELEAIRNACQSQNSLNLKDCTLYCTIEPNLMSYACANWARFNEIVYGVPLHTISTFGFQEEITQYDEAKTDANSSIPIISDCMKTESEEIFQLWKVTNGQFY